MHKNTNILDIAPNSLSDSELIASVCKAAADPLRLDILRVLKSGSYGVLELCEILQIKQSGLSHHLKVLANSGLVMTRKEGNSIFYRRALTTASVINCELIKQIFLSLDKLNLDQRITERLHQTHVERAELSRQFFSKNAKQFKKQQELIANHDDYAHNALDMLLAGNIHPNKLSTLEVGPGEGHFLGPLSRHFQNVIALDNSDAMLNLSSEFAKKNGLKNIQLIPGELKDLTTQAITADCIIANMVLHHVPSPDDFFQQAAKVINNQGYLVITDLCEHNQIWAHESCGDIWLGFNSEDLTSWSNAAGFSVDDHMFLGLRNGFQIQIWRFKKCINLEN